MAAEAWTERQPHKTHQTREVLSASPVTGLVDFTLTDAE